MATTLPEKISKKLEQYKKVRGETWAKDLEELIDDALLESQAFAPKKGRPLSDTEAERMAADAVKTYRKGQG